MSVIYIVFQIKDLANCAIKIFWIYFSNKRCAYVGGVNCEKIRIVFRVLAVESSVSLNSTHARALIPLNTHHPSWDSECDDWTTRFACGRESVREVSPRRAQRREMFLLLLPQKQNCTRSVRDSCTRTKEGLKSACYYEKTVTIDIEITLLYNTQKFNNNRNIEE